MNRRAFLSLAAISPLAHLLPAFARAPRNLPREIACDLLICGGSLGGVACALAAARQGLKVVLTEEFDWIGGQLTSQAVPPDEHPWIEQRGCTRSYRELRNRIRDYYRKNYPLTDAAKANPALNPGGGTVSRLCHEPRVALAALLEMLAPHIGAGRVRLLQRIVPVDAETARDRVRSVVLASLDGEFLSRTVITAPFFVDATELGDLLEVTKTEYVSGAESVGQTREPHAADVPQPDNHQAFTVCFAMDYVPDEDLTIEKPNGYDFWRNFVPNLKSQWPGKLLSWKVSHPIGLKPRQMGFDPGLKLPKDVPNLWTYRRIADRGNFLPGSYPSDICLVNWPQNDYWLGNLYGDRRQAPAIDRARDLSLALLYWMQTEAPRADGKTGWKGLRLRPEITGTDDGLAMAPYVRESRRIQALFTVTEHEIGTDARARKLGKKVGEFTAEKFPDSVGVGSYRIDLHPTFEGNNYLDLSSLPFQIPLGALLPKRVENLLPACKNIGTTHITNGCYRLHPVEWNIGEAVGELVAFCLAHKKHPHQVRRDATLLKDFQTDLGKAGFELDWPDDIAKMPR